MTEFYKINLRLKAHQQVQYIYGVLLRIMYLQAVTILAWFD